MKEIKAIIRPNKLPILRNTLMDTPGFPGMTVSKAEGCSAPNKVEKASIKDELTDYTQKIRIEIVCPDEVADLLMDKIIHVCQTGQVGDGIVWMTDVTKAAFIAKGL
ncbi:MAG: P-II family nitrogen regulator [Burkholderiaceae bacterium]|jgi:nitrogen regulatory protein P-II 1|uniref:P-II family nitrogen regulator n=1 Tax=Polynucleobacter sp. MWH-Loch1C5 TaxID=2689108 RepID=UPI001C0BB520|nr:P-II family nitrogen regulator [Polynucleobacter sp. MWH-Loch1C5]MBU3542908.1 P-II family nitrogen regulator [Polynucleobacter sp. MWH-Loch1C5]NBV00825.1 P-II family nitrogen regulator [Burkholderiaceae bacterium]